MRQERCWKGIVSVGDPSRYAEVGYGEALDCKLSPGAVRIGGVDFLKELQPENNVYLPFSARDTIAVLQIGSFKSEISGKGSGETGGWISDVTREGDDSLFIGDYDILANLTRLDGEWVELRLSWEEA